MNVLVVGAGIAGPTLAFWLLRAGHRVTLLERAPELRRGGYLIDFWGAGFEVAERMGIAAEVRRRACRLSEARAVAADGRRIASFEPSAFVGSGERYVSIARSELAAVIYQAVEGRAELVLDDTLRVIEDVGEHVRVTYESGGTAEFDLVLGTDGLHSQVRRLAFGAEERFEKYLGIVVAAFDVEGYRPRDELVAVMHAEVGSQVLRLALPDDVTMFLITVRHDGRVPTDNPAAQRDLLRARLAGAGWETPAILEAMAHARTLYFDPVSQIRMPSWTRGRVGLVGDAAACPSLLAGQGSALAMVEAYVLAAELARSKGDHAVAFARYEGRLARFLRSKQDAAERLSAAFAPRGRLQLHLRNTLLRLMGLPYVPGLVMGRSLRDAVELPAFPAA